jgi:starch-binding outer membrane protein, SusD/RagB family
MGNSCIVHEIWAMTLLYIVTADILMLKAEALMRKNGGVATQEAVDLVNQVRSRAFNDPTGQLYTVATLDLGCPADGKKLGILF